MLSGGALIRVVPTPPVHSEAVHDAYAYTDVFERCIAKRTCTWMRGYLAPREPLHRSLDSLTGVGIGIGIGQLE
jgi:hypothetical protein